MTRDLDANIANDCNDTTGSRCVFREKSAGIRVVTETESKTNKRQIRSTKYCNREVRSARIVSNELRVRDARTPGSASIPRRQRRGRRPS